MMNVYEIVTQKITEQLDRGVVPWRRPWRTLTASGAPVSWVTGKQYRGVNLFLLDPGEYLTFKQVQEHGGRIKKGERSSIVVFYKMIEKEANSEEEETKRFPYLRYYNVFEVDQCEGIKRKSPQVEEGETKELPPIKRAEFIIKKYENPPKIRHAGGSAYYAPTLDEVVMPKRNTFISREEYYSVLFHELAHSTGHKERLNRDTLTKSGSMRAESYAKEELIAEMASAMLCGVAKIDYATIENSAAYIAGWKERIKEDVRLIVTTASKAQRAADHILGVQAGA